MQLRRSIVATCLAAGAVVAIVHGSIHPQPAVTFTEDTVPSRPPMSVVSEAPASKRQPPRTSLVVYVAGAVNRPGLYRVRSPARVDDAVRAAGGVRPDADLLALNLAAPLGDGDEVAVYPQGEAPAPVRRVHRVKRRRHHRARRRADSLVRDTASEGVATSIDPATAKPMLDVNSATAEELAMLPGIGDSLAQNIVTVRETSGPFASYDDLLDVRGMTAAKLEALVPYLTVR